MSELAFNINGEGFEIPVHATGWRVRRMRAKGAPEVVYGREGTPLMLPIDAELADLRSEVDVNGRYRLDLVDQNNKAIQDAPSAYVQINFETAAQTSARNAAMSTIDKPTDNVAIEAMRLNAEMARSIIERFPQMMEAAATLLRAADGAGLPARAAVSIDVEEETVGAVAAAPQGFDTTAVLSETLSKLVGSVINGEIRLPGFGALLDWRKAAKPAELPEPAVDERISRSRRVIPVVTKDESPSALPPLDAKSLGHFAAVQAALSPEDRALAQEVARDLGSNELRTWFDELSKLSVPDAAERIRSVIHAGGKEGVL